MAGYRPEDDWALTDEDGNRIDGGWKVILVYLAVLIGLILIGKVAHIPFGVFVAFGLFVVLPILSLWLVVGGLRNGVMSAQAGGRVVRYTRAENPIGYWALIAIWGGFGASMLTMLVFVIRSIH